LSDNLVQAAPTLHTVDVFHNVFHDDKGIGVGFLGYEPAHPMTKVFTFEAVVGAGAAVESILEQAFELCTVGETATALAYSSRRLRYLRTGDVIAVDGTFYAVESRGFRQLDTAPTFELGTYSGTTPISVAAAA
jgi:hypothetical protein